MKFLANRNSFANLVFRSILQIIRNKNISRFPYHCHNKIRKFSMNNGAEDQIHSINTFEIQYHAQRLNLLSRASLGRGRGGQAQYTVPLPKRRNITEMNSPRCVKRIITIKNYDDQRVAWWPCNAGPSVKLPGIRWGPPY